MGEKMLCKTLSGNKKIFLALAFLTFFLLNLTSVFAVTYATTEDVFGILGDGTERTGAYNITFKVRSCDDSACSGESWSSPYTNATYNDISSLSNNRYFQYQSLFYTEDQNYTPMLFNVTSGYTILDFPPNSALISPSDEQTLDGQEQTFTCNATDTEGNLQNISLYHNATGTWHLNATNEVTGTENETSFVVSGLPYTTFVWNCLVTDSNGLSSFADSNFTLTTIADATKPVINSYSITSSLTSGETATIRADITDSSAISLVWFTINNTEGTLTNYTMSQEGSTDFYNTTFEVGKNGTWYYKVYANDSYGNLNDSMEWQSFSVSAPTATPENEIYPTYALPSSSITITADLSATDLLKIVNATLNVPSGFEFPFTSYPQTQEKGNFSALQTRTARWFVYLPNNETTHTFNVTWTDKYNNSFQGDNKQIIVTYDTANLTGRVETLESLVSTLQSNVSSLFTSVGNLQSDFSSLNDTVNSINATVTNNTQDIANLQGNVSVVQTDIINLQNNLDSINTTVNEHSQNISDLNGNVTQINLDISNINTNLTYVWNNITDLYNKVNNNTVNITDIRNDITTIDSQITSINNNINLLNSSINAFAENSTFVNIIAFTELEAGAVLESEIQVRDIDGNFVNASSVKISLYDPNDNLVVDNVNFVSQLGIGRYFYNYTTPSAPTGQWLIYVNVTRNGNSFIDREYFRLTGGPFDVRGITITDSTTPTLGISVILENMGDGVTDIVVDWNLTRTDTGALLDSGQDTIGVTNEVTHTITPSTTYTGEAQITFLGTWSSTEKAGAQETFTITSAPSSGDGDTGGGGSSGGGGITGEVIQEVVCNPPYIRYGKECCLDANNNSICDKDETKEDLEEGNKTKTEETDEDETPKKEIKIYENLRKITSKIGNFFSSLGKTISSNKTYLFIGFGSLILVAGILFLIRFIIKRKPRDITRLKSIKGIKVYGADGHKIGAVKEAYLGENRIYGWLIKVDRSISKKIKKKNILVKQKHIESIKHIMIIDKRVSEHLEKLDSEVK